MIDAGRLKQRMQERGISQAELARRVGIAQTSIFKIVSGASYNSRHLHKIARELGTTPTYLTGETDDPESDAPDDDLSADERRLIEQLRQIPASAQIAVRDLVKSLSSDAEPRSATLHSPPRRYAAGS